jgi:hypothetical protein
MTGAITMMRILAIWGMAAMMGQSSATQLYRDPAGRFTFSYPSIFGLPSPGTNDGFQDRVAAVAFSTFPARLKGEAVLTRGFPLLDLQAAGGFYDAITLEIFPDPVRALVVAQLPRLSAANMCDALGQPRHLDPDLSAFASLTRPQRESIGQVDLIGNADARVIACRTADNVAVFDKQRSARAGDPVQHVYGAVRFLPAPFSTFQVIAGGDAPDPATLTALSDLVRSFKTN